MSSTAYQAERPDLIILAITSRSRSTTTVGETSVAQWKEARLLKPSVFKPPLTTIEKGLVLKKLGRLARPDREQLREILRNILGE